MAPFLPEIVNISESTFLAFPSGGYVCLTHQRWDRPEADHKNPSVVIGALVGAAVTRYLEQRRVRALLPVAIWQLNGVVEYVCGDIFDPTVGHRRRVAESFLISS
jgi:hypothetical protein